MAGPGAKKKKRASATKKPSSPKRTAKKSAKRAPAKKPAKRSPAKKAPRATTKKAPKKPAKKPAKKLAKKLQGRPAKKPSSRPKQARARQVLPKKGTPAKAKPKPRPPQQAKRISQPPAATERLLAACAAIPLERSLTDEERAAMSKVAETARRFVGALVEAPEEVVDRIADFVDEVRGGSRPEPKSQDIRLGLGVLWGEQLRTRAGWRWVHLTYPDGFASYALVPDDRAFACFPLNRVPESLRADGRTNTSARVFESIRTGVLPARRANAYLVIG